MKKIDERNHNNCVYQTAYLQKKKFSELLNYLGINFHIILLCSRFPTDKNLCHGAVLSIKFIELIPLDSVEIERSFRMKMCLLTQKILLKSSESKGCYHIILQQLNILPVIHSIVTSLEEETEGNLFFFSRKCMTTLILPNVTRVKFKAFNEQEFKQASGVEKYQRRTTKKQMAIT